MSYAKDYLERLEIMLNKQEEILARIDHRTEELVAWSIRLQTERERLSKGAPNE